MKIAVLEPLGIPDDEAVALISDAIGNDNELIYYDTREEDLDVLTERSRGADAVVLTNFKYPRAVMENCPELRYICVAFTGYDHVDMEYCREHGIMVSNCSGYATCAVADLVFGFAIALSRDLFACDKAVRERGTRAGLIGTELAGKKFGIVGAGAIGSRVAAIAGAFGCEVYAYSRTVKDLPGVKFVSLEELLSTCDIVSLHVPQTPETTGLINAERLALMKPDAILINTARGPVVDSEALANALNEGRLAGAGIDVFETEPPIPEDHPLLHARNCICTPHIGFATQQAMEKRAVIVCDNLKAWLAGNPINLV